MPDAKFIIVTPAKDEAQYLQRTIDSLVSQTVLPAEWIIVDDGSVDETADIALTAARLHPWIHLVQRQEAGARDIGYGDTAAFCAGLKSLNTNDYDFVFKIDADVVLGVRYLQVILQKFAANPRLGIATGDVDELVRGNLVRTRHLPMGFNGMIKGWRRTCFEDIGGIPMGPGWDGIDCYKAMMLGWQTVTFEDEDLRVIHLRPAGSSVISTWHGWTNHGRALHFIGAHPGWVLASAFHHLASPTCAFGGLFILLGFIEATLKRAQRYEDQPLREYVRVWQRNKLAELLKPS